MMNHVMESQLYKEILEKALEALRNKDYPQAEASFRDLLGMLGRESESGVKILLERQRHLNNLLICLHHQVELNGSIGREKYPDFAGHLQEYLDVSGQLSTEERRKGASNIIESLLKYALWMELGYCSEWAPDAPLAHETLKGRIGMVFRRFWDVFCAGGEFPGGLLVDAFLDTMYQERRNVLRGGRKNQNYFNTLALAELALEFLDAASWARVRSEIMVLCSDVSLFMPDLSGKFLRFSGEREALNWLEKSLQEYPDNAIARERRQQLVSFLTAAEQINRFRHDAVSKIESIRGVLGRLQEKISDSELRGEVQAAAMHVRAILGTFRLTMQEKPAFRTVTDMRAWLRRFEAPDVQISVTGAPRPFLTDEDYVAVMVQNLLQNAREAYARNRIYGFTVSLSFDYDQLSLHVQDWAGGIPEALRQNDKLYEPYASSKGIQQNSGLGLASVREACRLLGADVSYEILREPDRTGTRFTVVLNQPERD